MRVTSGKRALLGCDGANACRQMPRKKRIAGFQIWITEPFLGRVEIVVRSNRSLSNVLLIATEVPFAQCHNSDVETNFPASCEHRTLVVFKPRAFASDSLSRRFDRAHNRRPGRANSYTTHVWNICQEVFRARRVNTRPDQSQKQRKEGGASRLRRPRDPYSHICNRVAIEQPHRGVGPSTTSRRRPFRKTPPRTLASADSGCQSAPRQRCSLPAKGKRCPTPASSEESAFPRMRHESGGCTRPCAARMLAREAHVAGEDAGSAFR